MNISQSQLDNITTYMDDEIRESLCGDGLTPAQFLYAYVAKDPKFMELLASEFSLIAEDIENKTLFSIEFIKAIRATDHSVKAVYAIDGTEFAVEWNNLHPETGEAGYYDLQVGTDSKNEDLACRVDEAIREGETDENPDLELYLFVRDTFDMSDCECA